MWLGFPDTCESGNAKCRSLAETDSVPLDWLFRYWRFLGSRIDLFFTTVSDCLIVHAGG